MSEKSWFQTARETTVAPRSEGVDVGRLQQNQQIVYRAHGVPGHLVRGYQ